MASEQTTSERSIENRSDYCNRAVTQKGPPATVTGQKTVLLDKLSLRVTHLISDAVAEWLRRWTRNPLGSPCVGSNPDLSMIFLIVKLLILQVLLCFCFFNVYLHRHTPILI